MTPSPVTATVVGLGPAGRIAAHRAAARGWAVTAFDPAGGTLPSTVGIWRDQLPNWAPRGLLAADFQPSVILADGTARKLSRAYGVINKESFVGLGGFRIERRALSARAPVATDHVIVTTGSTHAASGRCGQVRQLAIGHVFLLADVPKDVQQPVLMDFTPASTGLRATEPASFSYRILLGPNTFLVEETILATPVTVVGRRADDTALLDLLRRRQLNRLERLGLAADRALSEEVVSFPLLANSPGRFGYGSCGSGVGGAACPGDACGMGRRARLFGFAGGWMHPATGYSVGAVLAGVDDFLDQIGREKASIREPSLSECVTAIRAKWCRYFQRELRERGLAALLTFDAEQTAQFFSAFFSLPDDDVFAYLIGTSPWRTLRSMLKVAVPLIRLSPSTCAGLLVGFLRGPGRWRRR